MTNRKRLEIAKEAALLAGGILSNFKGELEVKYKGAKDIVTKADIECEKEIINLIKREFPGDGIYSEEETRYQTDKKGVWFIDPLDGTINFSRGLPLYGVSIAYVENDIPKIGVIYLPEQDELYYAESGSGAYCNSEKISVSKISSTEKAIVNIGDFNTSSDLSTAEELNKLKIELLGRLHDKCMRLKTFSSSAMELAFVAAGKIDAFITLQSHFYDIAAGIVLIQEAGGNITDFEGNKLTRGSQNMIASNSILNEEYKKILTREED